MLVPKRGAAQGHKQQARSRFTYTNIAKNCALVLGLMALNQAGTPGGVFFYFTLIVWACTSTEGALKALCVSYFALVANQAIVPKNFAFGPGRMILLFVVFGRILYDAWRTGYPLLRRPHATSLFIFSAVCVVLAAINQYFFVISVLKVVSFTVGAASCLLAADMLRRSPSDMTCWFYSIIMLTVAIGVATIPLGISENMFSLNNTGVSFFNGPFWHSQTLGPIAAMMLIYVACVYLFTPYRCRWLSLPLAVVLLYFLYRSGSRTAFVSLLLGSGAMVVSIFLLHSRRGRKLRMNLSRSSIVVLAVGSIVLAVFADVFTGGSISSKALSFIVKYEGGAAYGETGLSSEWLLSSRQGQIDMMLHSFKQNRMTGISFGTSVDPEFALHASYFSAPTEKGVLPLAVLEETGIIGAFFFVIFLFCMVRYFIVERSLPALGVFATFLGANMGEMMFFAFGGQGGFMWLIVAGAILLGERCVIDGQRR